MLTSKGAYENAYQLTGRGWKDCIKDHLKENKSNEKLEADLLVEWDNVDVHFKEELLKYVCANIVYA